MNRKFSMLLLLFAAMIMFTGCPGESPVDNPDDPNNPETPVNVVMQDVALHGTVKDASGNPLGGVKVTTGSLSATTNNDGTFTFAQAGTVDNRAVIKFEKSGYFTLTRSGDKADEMYMEPMLYRQGNDSITLQTTFNASAAKTLKIKGVIIDLPAGCMAKTDGSAYSGTVRADVLYLAPGNRNTASLMPGGDLATDKSDEMVLPIGMVDVIFTDNAGNLLKIKEKTDVKITFPAPSGVTDASLPLWTFDEARGVWKEEGSATLQGNTYTGTVSHFTRWTFGINCKEIAYMIHASACKNPARGALVTGYITDGYNRWEFPFGNSYTDSKGYDAVLLPREAYSGGTLYAYVIIIYKGQEVKQLVNLAYYDQTVHEFNFDGDCRQEITIHATACGKPAVGANVAATMDSEEHPEVVKMTTNSAGECVFTVPSDQEWGVTVLVSYKGQEEDVSFFTDNSGPKTINFAFDGECSIPEVCAIKFAYDRDNGGETDHCTEYLSWDNNGKRWRTDHQVDGSTYGVSIDVWDNLKLTHYFYENYGDKNWRGGGKPEYWYVSPIKDDNQSKHESLMLHWASAYFTITGGYTTDGKYHEISNLGGFKQRSATEMILGKACNVWDGPNSTVIWEWKKVIFRKTVSGKVTHQLLKITENVPTSAFSNQTIILSWIE